jgi:hypothetical protein
MGIDMHTCILYVHTLGTWSVKGTQRLAEALRVHVQFVCACFVCLFVCMIVGLYVCVCVYVFVCECVCAWRRLCLCLCFFFCNVNTCVT